MGDYAWDREIADQTKQKPKSNDGYHTVAFLREYIKKQAEQKYVSTPKINDYLTLRQRGQLEGMIENSYRLNQPKSTSNTSYTRTGTYDIASKLRLYDPTTSFFANWYDPKKNASYKDLREEHQKEQQYL